MVLGPCAYPLSAKVRSTRLGRAAWLGLASLQLRDSAGLGAPGRTPPDFPLYTPRIRATGYHSHAVFSCGRTIAQTRIPVKPHTRRVRNARAPARPCTGGSDGRATNFTNCTKSSMPTVGARHAAPDPRAPVFTGVATGAGAIGHAVVPAQAGTHSLSQMNGPPRVPKAGTASARGQDLRGFQNLGGLGRAGQVFPWRLGTNAYCGARRQLATSAEEARIADPGRAKGQCGTQERLKFEWLYQ